MLDPGAPRRCLPAFVCGLLCALVAIAEAQAPALVLIVPFETRAFAAGGTLLVQIWSAAQLDALEKPVVCRQP